MTSRYPEIQKVYDDLDAGDRDARAVTEGLTEAQGTWRPSPGSWSVSECLDHLAVANRVYVAAMTGAAASARTRSMMRSREARPGLIGAWFVRYLEPPVRRKIRTNRKITPRPSPSLADSLAAFLASQDEVRRFIAAIEDLDLARVRSAIPSSRVCAGVSPPAFT